jgi:hypothetical protein
MILSSVVKVNIQIIRHYLAVAMNSLFEKQGLMSANKPKIPKKNFRAWKLG